MDCPWISIVEKHEIRLGKSVNRFSGFIHDGYGQRHQGSSRFEGGILRERGSAAAKQDYKTWA
jgi:hypothetical protein